MTQFLKKRAQLFLFQNILFESIDSSARLRLVDFGFARLLPNSMEQQLKSVQVLRKMYGLIAHNHSLHSE